jgi:serine protease Do
MRMKSAWKPIVGTFALGLGLGCGQVLAGGVGLRWLDAQSIAFSAEERTYINVTQRVTPAVVGIQVPNGSGSGVIIRGDGVVLTNAHVVGNARQARVSLADGTEYTGQVLGRDPTIDIAVVRIAGNNFPVAQLADSDALEVGQTAIAIGNPLGFERTVTSGIVSGLNRALGTGAGLDELIQTDAAINPGNSGGPLLNSAGQVIGINTAVIRPGIATGLGFAVPINLARNIAEQLLTTGVIRRAFLGILYEPITGEIAAQLRLPVQQGLIVTRVEAGTPAASAGLRRGDIIVRIGDRPIDSGGDLQRFLRQSRGGQRATIVAFRGAQQVELQAVLGEVTEGQ